MFGSKPMTEQEAREIWNAEACEMILDKLPKFLEKLSNYPHDYGTICVAIGVAAAATARAMDKGPSGNITNFQASAVFWEFTKAWGIWGEGPKKMVTYSDLLYPQYAEKFTTISEDTWLWIQEEAKKHLSNAVEQVHPNVLAHWRSIERGEVPFGLKVVVGA